MATNNAVKITDSGIVHYDGAGTFTGLAVPLIVANGGTGDSSLTAFAVQCGGTTSTNPWQSVASVGTAGQALTSNGAGFLPSFQSVASSGTAYFFRLVSQTSVVADSTTYCLANSEQLNTSTTRASSKIYTPNAFTITKVYGAFRVTGALGSAENVTVFVRVNGTTDTNISTTVQLTANPVIFNNTALSISLSANDFFQIFITTPAWVTNPGNSSIGISIYGA